MVTPLDEIGGILLAAGSAQRFGANKLVNATIDEVPIGLLAARALASVVPLSVVVRAGDDATRRLFAGDGYHIVTCPDAARGMGVSLAAGVRALAGKRGCVVALADMPLIRPATIRRVCRRLLEIECIVRTRYQGRAGHPVAFPATMFGELSLLSDDRGGRPLLERYADLIEYIDTDDEGVVRDIDLPSDLDALQDERNGRDVER